MYQMEDYEWAYESILKKLNEYLTSPDAKEGSIKALMETNTEDNTMIERQLFVNTIKDLNMGIIPQIIENFADQILLEETQFVDLLLFYKIYNHFIPNVQVSQSLQGPLSASIAFDGKKKVLDFIAKYMRVKMIFSLSDLFPVKVNNGMKVITVDSFNDFFDKNGNKLLQVDITMFCNEYKLKDDPEFLDFQKMQIVLINSMTPKSLDDYLEEYRFITKRNGYDLAKLIP